MQTKTNRNLFVYERITGKTIVDKTHAEPAREVPFVRKSTPGRSAWRLSKPLTLGGVEAGSGREWILFPVVPRNYDGTRPVRLRASFYPTSLPPQMLPTSLCRRDAREKSRVRRQREGCGEVIFGVPRFPARDFVSPVGGKSEIPINAAHGSTSPHLWARRNFSQRIHVERKLWRLKKLK